MSKGLFANPKAALGFAGVTVGIAVLASFGMGAMVPDTRNDGRLDVSPEIEAAQAQEAAAKREAAEQRRNEPRFSWDGKKRVGDWDAAETQWAEVGESWGQQRN